VCSGRSKSTGYPTMQALGGSAVRLQCRVRVRWYSSMKVARTQTLYQNKAGAYADGA